MTASSVFNAYIDTNIMLMLAAFLWLSTRTLLKRSYLRSAFSTHLQVLYGLLLAVAIAPVIICLHNWLTQIGLVNSGYVPSISDYALSQYLNGKFQMAPSTFETLWMSRTLFIQNVVSLGSSAGIAIAATLGLGILVYSIRLLGNALSIRKTIQRSYLWRRSGRLEIRLTDRSDIPFSTRGLRRRYIVLPSTLLLEADDLKIAITHEIQHMRQGDLDWELALELARPLFFWNPGFAFFKREVEALRELACDQQVLMRKQIGIREYCDCLLRVCRNAIKPNGARKILVPSVPLVSSPKDKHAAKFLRFRVMSMLSRGRVLPGRWVSCILVLPLLAFISIGSIATQSNGDWSQDRLMLSTIVNLERLDQRTLATQY
ncbi:M56 family metallopeptidase [uncultured Roseovarius sp.]|uniref:M56 family metallopeptidase n=1 Tax=uncultured Roseovarius sp. TaxID=293344 RepID=UPI00260615B9|nr:M56 family metallopeptidase [uncultured Roseovarius sp.]